MFIPKLLINLSLLLSLSDETCLLDCDSDKTPCLQPSMIILYLLLDLFLISANINWLCFHSLFHIQFSVICYLSENAYNIIC